MPKRAVVVRLDGFGYNRVEANRVEAAPTNICGRCGGTILVARRGIIGGLEPMGAKYLPTIKDIKASQRFQQKQNALPKFKKASGEQTAKKRGKK